MIDLEGVGHIRIIKRINLKNLIEIFKDLYLKLKKILAKNRISLYKYPVRSMKKMLDSMKHFHDFTALCMYGIFDLIIIN